MNFYNLGDVLMCQLELHHPTDGRTENTEVSEGNLVMLISGGSTITHFSRSLKHTFIELTRIVLR